MKYEYKKLSKDRNKTEIEITVPFSEFDYYKNEAYKELAETVTIQGFRPGKGPRQSIEAKLGEKLINEAINMMLPIAAVEILTKENIRPISRMQYDLMKFAPVDGIVYKISFVEYPEVKLGDLSKIKVELAVEKTTIKDVDTVIKSIVRSSLKPEILEKYIKEPQSKDTDTKQEKPEEKTEKKEGYKKFAKEEEADFDLTDELIKELQYGNEKTVEAMREQVRKRLEDIKKKQAEDKYLEAILDEAVKISKVELPDALLESEVRMSEVDFNGRLKELKLDPETFLKTQGTTLEEKRKQWREAAEVKVKTELVLYQIAQDHEINAEDNEVESEIEAITDEKVRESYKSDDARNYIRTVLTKRKAVEKLKEIVEGKKK